MPTGYTENIEKGISFEDFVMECARAFGACISMKDEARNKKIPEEFKPETYHEECMNESKVEYDNISAMSLSECEKRAEKEYKSALSRTERSIKEKIGLQKKYEKMLKKVVAWKPPSLEHIPLKEFMIKQIQESMEFDCSTDYWVEEKSRNKILSGKEWKRKQLNSILKEIQYHAKEQKEENERVAARNLWVKQLRESLKKES